MNLVDITLIAETIKSSDVALMSKLLSLEMERSNVDVLKLLDVSIVQKEVSTGNIAILARVCYEHPAKMIKSEIDEYTSKASEKIKIIFEEVLSSENEVFSIKSLVTKLL